MRDLQVRVFRERQPYIPIWQAMRAFVDLRHIGHGGHHEQEELWIMEHEPVFTLGQAGDMQHVKDPGDIPLVQCDRGGQVTYHGPGQILFYTLFNLHSLKRSVRDLVRGLERTVVEYLATLDLAAITHPKAPGVYIGEKKISSIGLRVSRGWSYHGLALNVNMDLAPFSAINPCGVSNLTMTNLDAYRSVTPSAVIDGLLPFFAQEFPYRIIRAI